jgi:hypothetical protein
LPETRAQVISSYFVSGGDRAGRPRARGSA